MAFEWRRLGTAARGVAIAAAIGAAMVATVAEAGQRSRGFTDEQLMDGFRRTVFGVEYGSSRYGLFVKKYTQPVTFAIENRAASDRSADVRRFVRSLPKLIRGLQTSVVADRNAARFTVIVVDRKNYVEAVRADVLGSHDGVVRGECISTVDVGSGGIRRSVAVVVADEGEGLFRRCMTEEILQGLGPMNDDPTLSQSMFNDRSTWTRMMPFDRAILSMLYDPRIRPGMSKSDVAAVLPMVVADVQRRLN